MSYTPFLSMFGLDPEQFVSCTEPESIKTGDGASIALSAVQRQDFRECPLCGRSECCVVKDHYVHKLRLVGPSGARTTIAVLRPKFRCSRCGRCFTVPLRGVGKGKSLTDGEMASIKADFAKMMTFAQIADAHGIDESHAVRLFDKAFPAVPRRPLPKVLCIDEILFCERVEGKYPALLYDWERRELVDAVPSRQKGWLEPYFASIPPGERSAVKWFVSDMYDEYAACRRKFFPQATHVIDMFHVVKQLTDAIKRMRAEAMASQPRDGFEYSFMKSRWRVFTMRKHQIPESYYTHRSDGVSMRAFDALMLCLKASDALYEAWLCLQELYTWREYSTWTEAERFVERIAAKLDGTDSPTLRKVAATYMRWRVEIANGMAANSEGKHFSNSVAEGLNSRAKTLKKISNGCLSFPRFRKRMLLIMTYSKKGFD